MTYCEGDCDMRAYVDAEDIYTTICEYAAITRDDVYYTVRYLENRRDYARSCIEADAIDMYITSVVRCESSVDTMVRYYEHTLVAGTSIAPSVWIERKRLIQRDIDIYTDVVRLTNSRSTRLLVESVLETLYHTLHTLSDMQSAISG